MASNVTEGLNQPQSLKEYSLILKEKLHSRLSYCLALTAASKPSDPIEFISTHLRHLSLDITRAEEVECEQCAKFLNPDIQVNQNIVESQGNLQDLSQKSSDESNLLLEIAGSHFFETKRWEDFDADGCWREMSERFGERLRWWHVARNVCSFNPPRIEPEDNRKAWKTIRVFVSSTFKDFFSERDWLVKHVFPEFRDWCSERRLFLAECDLRWGVPFESTSREILLACLAEIDRCREENVQPYFVGLIGERYGWVPRAVDFPADLRRVYKWLPGMSITALEFCTGALWDRNPNALFLLRNKKWLDDIPDLNIRKDCEDSAQEARESLLKVKASQVSEYQPQFNRIHDGHAELTGLESFGRRVLEFLKRRVAVQYPSISTESLSSFELQHEEHQIFMVQRSQILLGRDELVGRVSDYIENGPDASFYLQRLSLTDASASGNASSKTAGDCTIPALVLSGSAGSGKSSIMAYCARLAADNADNRVVVHFVGATSGSTTLYRVLTRLWYECLGVRENEIPSSFEELRRSLETVFRKANAQLAELRKKRLVIFIDAVNQMDDDGDTLDLLWLPKLLPANVRLVVSALEGRSLDALHAAALPELAVGPLTLDVRKQIVVEYLRVYNKRLTDQQLNTLLAKQESGSPLWLSLACEDLRVFGQAELIPQKINSMAADLFGLIRQVLERVIAENVAGGDLVQACLSLIRASRFGLFESELVELLVDSPLLPDGAALTAIGKRFALSNSFYKRVPAESWAVVYLDLKQFLRPSGGSGAGRLDFYHRTFSKVSNSMFLENPAVKRFWHSRLADYFQLRCKEISRKCAELPHQLVELEEKERLQKVLLEPAVFRELYKEDTKLQLLAFWRSAADYDTAGTLYVQEFNKWVAANEEAHLAFSASYELGVLLGRLLIDMGQFKCGEEHLTGLLTRVQSEIGTESREAGEVLLALVTLYKLNLKKFVYGNSEGSRNVNRLGQSIAPQCLELLHKHWDRTSIEYADALIIVGTFHERYELEAEALQICEERHHARGLVELYSHLGCNEQGNEDIDVPRRYHEKAVKIALVELGKYHELTSLAYNLFGQTLWNRMVYSHTMSSENPLLEECLSHYMAECDILTNLYGEAHPLAVRSREDCIIIIEEQLHGHDEELARLKEVQTRAKKAEDANIGDL